MQILSSVVLLLAICASACSAQEAGSQPGARQGDRVVLAVLGRDTVFRVADPDGGQLLWASGLRPRRPWKSGPLLSSSPIVRLTLVNRDSFPDLFLTIQFEEFILGEVLLNGRDGPREVFKSGPDACSVPELKDVNGDGLADVIEKQAGALSRDECRGDPYAGICLEAYPTEWLQVWLQQPDGSFRNDSLNAKEFYSELTKKYSGAARDLRRALAARTGPPTQSPRCNEAMAESLDNMAARARRIATIP
jgi:hypothetical protein